MPSGGPWRVLFCFEARKDDRLGADAISRFVVRASDESGLRIVPGLDKGSGKLGRRCNEGMGEEMGVRASMMEGAWPKVASEDPEAGSAGSR